MAVELQHRHRDGGHRHRHGYDGVEPGVEGRSIQEVRAAKPDGGADLRGPYIQGPPGGRFIYLNWGTVDDSGEFAMFRRAKLWLEAVPPEVLAAGADLGVLVGRVGLTDPRGNPVCASVRPPLIEWSAATV